MKILLLLCLAGATFGLQPTLKYRYWYMGFTETGIPEISTDRAGVSITLFADVEVHENGHAVIQFDNIKIGDRFGKDEKHQFTAINDRHVREALEAPFEANLFGKEEYSMLVESEDVLWLRNIRRATVGLFKNALLEANFQQTHIHHSKTFVPKVFTLEEETILGTCDVIYTVHKLDGVIADTYNKQVRDANIETDVQLEDSTAAPLKTRKTSHKKYYSKKSTSSKFGKNSKGPSKFYRKPSVPELQDDLYHVTRTVDFDHCRHNVVLRHSSGGFHFNAGSSTYDMSGARSSVSEYTFRGSGGAFRMESVQVHGIITAKAFGISEERMHTTTSQTLILKSVEEQSSPRHISPSVEIHGWMQEVLTIFNEPKIASKVPWVTYTGDDSIVDIMELMIGVKMTDRELAARKQHLIECVRYVAKAFAAEKASDEMVPEHVMEFLTAITDLLQTLPKQTITDIVDEIIVKDTVRPEEIYAQKILIDGIVASGTKRAYQIILNLLKTKKISDFQALFISATAMTTLQDVTVIPKIADFIKEISLTKEPFVGSTVLINFANMVHHYCIMPQASTNHYAGAVFGDEGCNMDYIEKNFLPHVNDIVLDEDKTWERIVAIKVLHKLGLPSTVDILGPVALGQKGPSDLVRTNAIYALSRWTLPWATRDHAMEILSKIYTNVGEIPRIRAAALIMYSSWGPEPSFFYRLATLSWSEPSMAMASFYKSLIQGFVNSNHPYFLQQTQAATHALKMVRPSASLMRYPSFDREFKSSIDGHLFKIGESGIFYFPYPEPSMNFDAYSFVMNSMNGFHMTVSELFLSTGGIGDFVKNTFAKYEDHDRNTLNTEKLYSEIQKILQSEPTSKREPIMTVYWRVLENMQFLFPITKETLEASQFTDPIYIGSLLLELQTGLSRSLGKFWTLASFKEFYPNEMGLPVLTNIGGHMAFADTFNARLSVSTSHSTLKKAHLFVEDYFKSFSRISGEVSVFVPWSNSRIMTTVKTTRGISTPTLYTIDVDNTSASDQKLSPNLQISVESAYDTKHSLVKAKTLPEIGTGSLTITGQNKKQNAMTLLKRKNVNKVIEIPQTYTGLAYTLTWDSQFRYPFDLFGFSKMFNGFKSDNGASSELAYLLSSHTAEYWSLQLEFDPIQSETKNITFGLKLQLATEDKDTDMGQISQTSGQSEYGQVPWEYSQYGQEQFEFDGQSMDHTDEFEETNPDAFNIHDNFKQKCHKIEKYYGSKASTLDLSLGYYGGHQNREYEVLFSWTKPDIVNERQRKKGQITLLRSPIPGVDHKPLSVCIDNQIISPVISSMSTLENVFDQKLDVEFSRSVTPYCKGKPTIAIETNVKMSPKRIDMLRNKLPEDPNFTSYDPVHAFYNVVYDDVRSKITWEDVCNKKTLPIMSTVINVLDNTFNDGIHSYKCDKKEPSNQLDVHMHRCTDTDLWHFEWKRDSYSLNVDDVAHHRFLDYFLSVGAFTSNTFEEFLAHHEPSDKCVIKETSVRTFDGVVFDYKPTTCWTLAAKDCAEDKFLVFIRECPNGTPVPETRIIDRENGIVVHSGEIEYRGTPKQSAVKVYKGEGRDYVVELPNRIKVTVTDTVKIETMADEVCGICGTKDHEKIAEFMGPQHCIFTEADQFFNVWTVASDLCDIGHVHEIREEVEDYQRSCQKTYDFFTHSPSYQPMHTEYGYIVREIGDNYCISLNPLPYCPHGYSSINSNHIYTSFKCWDKEVAPELLSSCVANGQERIDSTVNYQPSSIEKSVAKIDFSCVQTPK